MEEEKEREAICFFYSLIVKCLLIIEGVENNLRLFTNSSKVIVIIKFMLQLYRKYNQLKMGFCNIAYNL